MLTTLSLRKEYPNSLNELDTIEYCISKEIFQLTQRGYGLVNQTTPWSNDTRWTSEIKYMLENLAQQFNSICYPRTDVEKASSEWLFDIAWIKVDESAKKVAPICKKASGLLLACECEWKTNEDRILEDLLKLAFIDADYRLFIYTNLKDWDRSKFEHPVDLFDDTCIESKGNRYLFLGIPSTRDGKYRVDFRRK